MNNYTLWLEKARKYDYLYNELFSIKDSEAEIEDRFYKELSFGTGGLRGIIGAGTNRMNIFTVEKATAGLAKYIIESDTTKKVVIAYDSRNMSREFANTAAGVLSSFGISVYLFNEITPTPILSYAVRELKAGAGIVITASHNPKEYNGYKVYNKNGCQITDEVAKATQAYIAKTEYFEEYNKSEDLIHIINNEILDKYIEEIKKYSLFDKVGEFSPKIVYTPLNGTGNIPVRRILSEIGVKDLLLVEEQTCPDGNFPTCPYPNPEEKEALALALKKGREEGAELILATDPDADRVGIAVKNVDGELILLNGNETGLLIMNYMLERKSTLGTIGNHPSIIKTIVTTDMAFSIAEKYSANVIEVLTGFKYIGEKMDTLDNFVMGMEESYGYLIGSFARDKDAVSAAMIITEMYAYYRSLGISLYEKLLELYSIHGYYLTALTSKTYKGSQGAIRMNEIINEIRKNPTLDIDNEEFIFTNFANGIDSLPKSNVLRFKSENVRILIRPSGTEPKIKIYYQIKGKTKSIAEAKLKYIKEKVEKCLS